MKLYLYSCFEQFSYHRYLLICINLQMITINIFFFQGIELSNPQAHAHQLGGGTQSTYFSETGTFSKIKKTQLAYNLAVLNSQKLNEIVYRIMYIMNTLRFLSYSFYLIQSHCFNVLSNLCMFKIPDFSIIALEDLYELLQ